MVGTECPFALLLLLLPDHREEAQGPDQPQLVRAEEAGAQCFRETGNCLRMKTVQMIPSFINSSMHLHLLNP